MTIKRNLKNNLLLMATVVLHLNTITMVYADQQSHVYDQENNGDVSHIDTGEYNDFIDDEELLFLDQKPEPPLPLWRLMMQNVGIYVLNQYLAMKDIIRYYSIKAQMMVIVGIKHLYNAQNK